MMMCESFPLVADMLSPLESHDLEEWDQSCHMASLLEGTTYAQIAKNAIPAWKPLLDDLGPSYEVFQRPRFFNDAGTRFAGW